MIFAPDLAAKILDGTKTVTRRPVKLVPNLQADGWDSGRDGMMAMPCRYAVGKTYAVQPGRGKKATFESSASSKSRWGGGMLARP